MGRRRPAGSAQPAATVVRSSRRLKSSLGACLHRWERRGISPRCHA
jgi:hypothetical protein